MRFAALILTCLLAGPAVAQAPESAPTESEIDARLAPSMVSLHVRRVMPPELAPRFRAPSRVKVELGSGTGVVVSREGLVATNAHVVDKAVMIQATFQDGVTIPAGAVLFDRSRDLALLQLRGEGPFQPVDFASEPPRKGDMVFAIGDAFGKGRVARRGEVLDPAARLPDFSLAPMLLTSARVDPGQSGGALTDAAGRLVGLLVARMENVSSNLVYGVAIPLERLKEALAARRAGRVVLSPLAPQ